MPPLRPALRSGARPAHAAHAARAARAVRVARLLLAVAAGGSAVACGSAADAAWNRGEAVAQLVAERSRRADAATVNLRDLAPFRWERLHLLPPGETGTSGSADGALGPSWAAVAAAAPNRPGAQLLVFTAAGDVVAAAALPPDAARFDDALLGRSYAADSATFTVRREGEAPPRLGR